MSVPDYQEFMYPLLKFAADGIEHEIKDMYETLADHFELTPEDKNELLPSGTQSVYKNRIGWARTYLKKAGLLESPKRGKLKITQRGLKLLDKDIDSIDNQLLKRYDEFKEFQRVHRSSVSTSEPVEYSQNTPEEQIESAIDELKQNLSHDLLEYLKSAT